MVHLDAVWRKMVGHGVLDDLDDRLTRVDGSYPQFLEYLSHESVELGLGSGDLVINDYSAARVDLDQYIVQSVDVDAQ